MHFLSSRHEPIVLTQRAPEAEVEWLAARVGYDPSSLFNEDGPWRVIL